MAISLCLVNQILNYIAVFMKAIVGINQCPEWIGRIRFCYSWKYLFLCTSSRLQCLDDYWIIILDQGEEWLWIHITQLFWAKKEKRTLPNNYNKLTCPMVSQIQMDNSFYKWWFVCKLQSFFHWCQSLHLPLINDIKVIGNLMGIQNIFIELNVYSNAKSEITNSRLELFWLIIHLIFWFFSLVIIYLIFTTR